MAEDGANRNWSVHLRYSLRMRVGDYGLAFLIAMGPSIPRPTGACSILPRFNADVGEQPMTPGDTTPPTFGVTYRIERPNNFQGGGCDHVCAQFGYIVFEPTPMDDRTPVEFVRYRFEIVDGTPPTYAYFEGTEYRIDYDGTIGLSFDKDTGDFTFDVKITAIDLGGNESAPVVLTIDGRRPALH